MTEQSALIAMSGGVDSSVAACLMCERGFDCVGITMKLFDNEDVGLCRDKACCSMDDIADARSVAGRLNMPYYVVNFTDNFKDEVIGRFIEAYRQGFTPNPCIDCNRYIKFRRLYQRRAELDLNYIVTGHYARIERDAINGRYLLKKAVDASKDQSYVLYSFTQEQLAHTLLPLGELAKTQVRELAARHGFINAAKHDSQDICFVKDGDYAGFIEQYTGQISEPGNFLNLQGKVIGRHRGLIRYTIGQRHGLGISAGYPVFVCAKDTEKNTVTVGGDEALMARSFLVKDVNLIAFETLQGPLACKVKIRYKQQEQPATIEPTANDTIKVVFEEPQRALAAGQAAVFYDNDIVLGGGTITASLP